MSVTGDKQKTIKYALKLIDALFVDKQAFQNINVKNADDDPHIKCIYSNNDTIVYNIYENTLFPFFRSRDQNI